MGRLEAKKRVRAKIFGTNLRPRVSVSKSNKFLSAQAIDDEKMVTLDMAKGLKKEGEKVGEELGKKLIAKKIKTIVFDRNGYLYHGRVKAVADGLRKAGLVF